MFSLYPFLRLFFLPLYYNTTTVVKKREGRHAFFLFFCGSFPPPFSLFMANVNVWAT